MYAQAYFLENEICHQKCQFPFIDLTKLYRYCALHLHCDSRKSSIFPIFVIFVIYRPRFCPFFHFVIVLYIALYIALFDFVIALYIALRGTRKIYLSIRHNSLVTLNGQLFRYPFK